MNAISPMATFLRTPDFASEFEILTAQVRRVRGELAAIRPDELRDLHIARASDHLDAVETTAESATNRILDAAEQIEMFAREGLDGAPAETVTSSVTRIYEACNFHDLTAQRVRKVAETLDLIEIRLGWLARALGPVRDDPAQLARAVSLQIAANDDQWGCPIDQEAVDGLLAKIV
jgi:chemotaxis regulatin CheY-phosphate phosphatase CheZ